MVFTLALTEKSSKLLQAKGNISSTRLHPRAVDGYVEAEKHEGCLVGPIPPELHKHCQLSPISLIPQTHQPGRWCLIVDLFSPPNGTVNDWIDPVLCSMQYATIDQAVSLIRNLGKGTQLSKLDLKNA